jgi:hypothetical protein
MVASASRCDLALCRFVVNDWYTHRTYAVPVDGGLTVVKLNDQSMR